MFAPPVASRTLKGSSNGTERAFRHSPYRNVRGEAGIAVISCTVMEEGNADSMLAEMVRVTKPGGRVAVMVRALDVPWLVNVPVRPELKTKAEIPRGFVGEDGCADASLGKRLLTAGLQHVKMFPQFVTFD